MAVLENLKNENDRNIISAKIKEIKNKYTAEKEIYYKPWWKNLKKK